MPPSRSRQKPAAYITWILGGMIAVTCGYVAYRLHASPHVSSRVRWSMTVTAAFMLLLFGYSFIDPKVWAWVLGARLPRRNRAAVIGHSLALMLLALLAVTSVWLLRAWIWP